MSNKLRVAFIENQLAFRGTQGTCWSLAHFNETMLGNKSIIISRSNPGYRDEDTTDESITFFTTRFETHFIPFEDVNQFLIDNNIDVAYVPTGGDMSTVSHIPTSVPTISHCVFSNENKAATIQTAISDFVSQGKCHVLQNIIHVDFNVKDDLREELNIPKDAIVFGRYGGYGTFNIPFVHDVIAEFIKLNKNVYFLFMNTKPFHNEHPNIIHVSGSRDIQYKTRFINTCDAMLHARMDGETFGMACGEFAVLKKPIITSPYGYKAHFDYLNNQLLLYKDPISLWNIFNNFYKGITISNTKYEKCLPEHIIPYFDSLLETAIDKFKLDKIM